MEQYEMELIKRYEDQDPELKELYAKHLEYAQEVDRLENKRYLNPQEEMELKNIKKMKLAGKTRILNILDRYRQQEVGDET